MGKVTGFLDIERAERGYRPVTERIAHYKEFVEPLDEATTRDQAARCMDCGIPYCHSGCPVNNQIPDWNDLVYQDNWRAALDNLHSTNNFPEFTGRICPAPCEASCTLNLDDNPVTIKTIECAIVDRGFQEGWITPKIACDKTGKSIAIIGAGPAGMAAAQQLARAGHDVHVYEKNANAGGLLRYGIPDFKLEKALIERRVKQLEAEGVQFHCNVHVGGASASAPNGTGNRGDDGTSIAELQQRHDAVLLAGGSEQSRDLPVPGRELDGIHFAMDFLPQQNRRVSGEALGKGTDEIAKGKHIVVIGGGDTGSDCIGTSIRQGAKSVTQIEIMVAPPEAEDKAMVWPHWPMKMRTSSSQMEGAERDFAVMTKSFTGSGGRVTKLNCVRVDDKFQEIKGSEFELKADMVLLAMGFTNPVHKGMLEALDIALDARQNVLADETAYLTSKHRVYAAGDMRRGQSLVVWAIREGRQAAHAIDKELRGGHSDLPR